MEHRKSKDVARLAGISMINGALTIYSFLRGYKSSSGILYVEGAHDIGDTAVTSARALALHKGVESKSWYQKFRRATYGVVSFFGAAAMVKSGFDFKEALDSFDGIKDVADNLDKIADASVIAGGNEISYVVSNTLESEDELVDDARKHAKLDRDVSLRLAGAVALGSAVPFVAEGTGVWMGYKVVKTMWPSSENLSHEN